MTDYQDKYRERWKDRRKRSYNWKKLVIMILALVVILIVINRLNKIGEIQQQPDAEFIEQDSAQQDVPGEEIPITPPPGENP
ncbi:MAG: hypothetical protein ACP5F3_00760 [Candidatus Syntrophosphaera sp.]